MVKIFTDCSERTVLKFENLIERENHDEKAIELDLEAEFSSLALDIIGLGVFNYDFGSVTKESPVIKVWSHIYCFPSLICKYSISVSEDQEVCYILVLKYELLLLASISLIKAHPLMTIFPKQK